MSKKNGKRKQKRVGRPLPDGSLERYAEILKALANPARLRLVNLLVGGERSVSELCEMSGLKQSLVSQQLRTLRFNGIVSCRKEITRAYYRLKEDNVISMLRCLCKCGDDKAEQLRRQT